MNTKSFKRAVTITSVIAISVAAIMGSAADAAPRLKVSTLSFDFNTPGALASDFSTYLDTGTLIQSANGGIDDTGAIAPDPLNSTNATVQPNANYSMGPVGAKYNFSGYMRSLGNSGYSGFGFTSLDNTSDNVCGCVANGVFRPKDAFGISVHGGGWELHNGSVDYSGSWSGSGGLATDLKTFDGDLIGNTSVSPSSWYKLVFILEKTSTTEFSVHFEVWAANADGSLINPTYEAAFEKTGLVNSTINSATELSSYINFSGWRMTQFDNFSTTVVGSKITGAPAGSLTEEPDPEPETNGGTTTTKKITGFYGDSSFVNPTVAKRIKAQLKSPSTITAVTCTGSTSGTKATAFDKKLALARATAACKIVKSIAKSATIKVVAKPAAGNSPNARAVTLAITR